MKKCLIGWRDGNLGSYRTKWSSLTISRVTTFLLQCKMPVEIHRAVRGLDCLSFWKGLEYRTFLYYIGIVVLKPHLPEDAYKHFLLLFCSITICSSENYSTWLDLAHEMLLCYVEHYADIYGEDYITSNVHNLTHLVDDVKRFGILSTFNAYPFENKLFLIKNLLRTGKNPLAQVAKRISELSQVETKSSKIKSFPILKQQKNIKDFCLNNLVIFNESAEIYSNIELNDFLLKADVANKWFLTKENEVVEMQFAIRQDGNISIYGNKCIKNLEPYFESPLLSTFFDIYVAEAGQLNSSKLYCISSIKCKLVAIYETNEKIVFIPLLHTLNQIPEEEL